MIGDAVMININRKRKQMTKKPKIELYPIAKVDEYEFGKVKSSFWVVQLPDGTEVQCASYQAAEKAQQHYKPLDKKEKVC